MAADAIRAEKGVMILLAQLRLVSAWDVFLLLKFVFTMRKGTGVAILARSLPDPTFAELSFDFQLIITTHDSTIRLEGKWIAGTLFVLDGNIIRAFLRE